jgi:O-antigen/teichoic acid export membrane protein
MNRWSLQLSSSRRNLLSGVAAQSLLSAASFAIALLLVRTISKDHFGLYTLGTTVITLAAGIMNALIYTQMTVTAPRMEPAARPAYQAAMLLAQYLILGPAVVVAVLFGIVWSRSAGDSRAVGLLIPSVGLACLGYALLEFSRRLNYLTDNGPRALAYDTLYVCLLATGLALLVALGQSDRMYWLTYTLIGIVALACGHAGLRSQELPWTAARGGAVTALIMAWSGGGWALAGMLVTWIQNSSYIYLLQVASGSTAVADANAARLLLVPPLVLQTGLVMALLPRLAAHTADGDRRGAIRHTAKVFGLVLAAVLLYCGAILWFWDSLSKLVLGSEYTGLHAVAGAWAVVLCLIVLRSALSVLLQAERRFRVLTLYGIVAAAFALVCMVPLIARFGVIGSVLGLAVGEMTLVGVLSFQFVRSRGREN